MRAPPFDVAVVGGGPAGLATALGLSQRSQGATIALVEGGRAAPNPARVLAISPGSARLFEDLRVWRDLEREAAPVLSMVIADGEPDDPIRRKELSFEGSPEAPLAHIVAYDAIVAALDGALADAKVTRLSAAASGLEAGAAAATLLTDHDPVRARLVVAADGGESRLREGAGVKSVQWDYGQIGIVATIAHRRDHDGVAAQTFFPSGPFAALPLPGRRCSIVWSEQSARARQLIEGPREAFVAELGKRFPARLGAFTLESAPQGFPLIFRLARRFVAPRLALVADAAHRVHPLAGQGLNLGLRDVAALVDVAAEAMALGLDPGDANALEAYERRRRFDVAASGLGMDAMNKLFSNRAAWLRELRDFGLRLVDRAPLAKSALIREAEGV